MTPQELHLYLQQRLSYRLHLRINRNRTRLIGATWPDRHTVRLSVHHRFLEAPPQVVDAIVSFAQRKETSQSRSALRRFISQLSTGGMRATGAQGRFFDLEEVMAQINQFYFGGDLDLSITWFGRKWRSRRLGEYCRDGALVRIHRQLDSAKVPWQFLHFVVYHEMLHHVVPPHVSKTGRVYPHTAEFRRREREFAHFEWAKRWERDGWT